MHPISRSASFKQLLTPQSMKKNREPMQLADQLDWTKYAMQRHQVGLSRVNETLRKRLASELDLVIKSQLQEHPEMEGKYFVGVVTDEQYSAEVVPMDQAVAAVEDADPEEAREQLSRNPVSFFTPGSFKMKTPQEEAYTSFQYRLNQFFDRNQMVVDYLRGAPLKKHAPTE